MRLTRGPGLSPRARLLLAAGTAVPIGGALAWWGLACALDLWSDSHGLLGLAVLLLVAGVGVLVAYALDLEVEPAWLAASLFVLALTTAAWGFVSVVVAVAIACSTGSGCGS